MKRTTLSLVMFMILASQVAIIGVAKIKSEQRKMDVEFSAVEFNEFKHQVEMLYGVEVLDSLDSTHCMRDFWNAYQGEGWNDSYCYQSYNHLIIYMGK